MFDSLWCRLRTSSPNSRRLSLDTLEERITPVVIAVNDVYSVEAGRVLTVDAQDGVLANDFNTTNFGAVLTATLAAGPFYTMPPGVPIDPNSLSLNLNGSFSFAAPADIPRGQVQFTYVATDTTTGELDIGTVTINIQPSTSYYAAAAGFGGGPQVRVFDSDTGLEVFSFMAFQEAFTGGVRVATGDLNMDGVDEIVVGAGPGGGPAVQVFDGQTGNLVDSFFAFDPAFSGGVYVAVGDVDGDGDGDIVTGAGDTGGPVVRVFDGTTLALLTEFLAYEASFRGGVFVGTGDIRDIGRDAIITGAGPGGGPLVRAFDVVANNLQLLNFFSFDPNQRGGVHVATGDFSGNGKIDVVAGSGVGSPIVNIHDGETGALQRSFQAFNRDEPTGAVFLGGPTALAGGFAGPNNALLTPVTIPASLTPDITPLGNSLASPSLLRFATAQGGVRVATVDRTRDGVSDIVIGNGPGTSARLRVFDGTDLTEIENIAAFNQNFLGGVFVGGSGA